MPEKDKEPNKRAQAVQFAVRADPTGDYGYQPSSAATISVTTRELGSVASTPSTAAKPDAPARRSRLARTASD